jgi:hypothetical protein
MSYKIKGKFNHIDELIKTTIELVRRGKMEKAALSLTNLAGQFSEVGLQINTFLDIRFYIIEEAKKNSSIESINQKLTNAEKQLRGKRNASNKQSKQSA